jgi:hypothetical protein
MTATDAAIAAPAVATPRSQRAERPSAPLLEIKARLRDGRRYAARLPAERHRRIQLGLLHCASDGYVELAAGPRPAGGKVRFITRKDPGHFLPGGATGTAGWLAALLALAEHHARRGDELAVAPAVRHGRGATKEHLSHTNWLWIDVDGTEGLPAVRELLHKKPAHLIVQSAGSGGVHCYWRLEEPLHHDAEHDWLAGSDGRVIEASNERLIYALGYTWQGGRPVPSVADLACKDRSRVMRLAGTVNGKTGKYARIMWADFALPAWSLRDLLGDLPEAPKPKLVRRRAGATVMHDDPYKRIAPAEYFHRLAGIEVPTDGFVSCPNPAHEDTTPSCHVGRSAGEGWWCHGCGAGGAIYDLASVLLGGPTGRWLRGEEFRRARDLARVAVGDRSSGAR